MKFIVPSAYLQKHLTSISGAIAKNPTIPILENFLFEATDGKLMVTASDSQMSMTVELEVDMQEKGKIAVPSKILLETLRNLPEQPVTFSMDEESYNIEISSNNGQYKLVGENATDFPQAPPAPEDENDVKIFSSVLSDAINNTLLAVSNDELRPAMNGVYLRLSEDNATFVATDSHRLVKYSRTDVTSAHQTEMIIPKKALSLLKSTLPGEETPVVMRHSAENAFFTFSNLHMTCRLIDERFPDYENVIPLDNQNEMTIDRAGLLGSLKRTAIYANQTTHQVRFKIAGNDLTISSEDIDFSNEAQEKLSCDHQGEDIDIGFNGKFLGEMLANLSAKQVTLKLADAERAGLIFPVEKIENEEILVLIMPIMLNDYMD